MAKIDGWQLWLKPGWKSRELVRGPKEMMGDENEKGKPRGTSLCKVLTAVETGEIWSKLNLADQYSPLPWMILYVEFSWDFNFLLHGAVSTHKWGQDVLWGKLFLYKRVWFFIKLLLYYTILLSKPLPRKNMRYINLNLTASKTAFEWDETASCLLI